jgi:hypothetical protein
VLLADLHRSAKAKLMPDVIEEPYAPITADGHRLIGGERVRFERPFYRFRSALVDAIDGPMVWLRLGKRRELAPAGWLQVE